MKRESRLESSGTNVQIQQTLTDRLMVKLPNEKFYNLCFCMVLLVTES